ncbi:MAG TPA: helix-turn-helix transcriptional regulator [Thermomicrobiales bacterium]|nr:helix-turn-helix transcriptional regulator [Thermomicrobiales bacterium]
MSGAGTQVREEAPAFNPADWVDEATRHVDVGEGTEPLLGVLAAHEAWPPPPSGDPHRQEVIQRLADALKERTPLYELTAALIAPYLLVALPAPGDAAAGDPAVIRANLGAGMRHLFASPAASGYDPWAGLAEWLWSHQTAWAVAAMQQQLGRESVRALTADEYRRILAEYLYQSDPLTFRERSGQLLITYAQELAKVVVEALALPSVSARRREVLLGLRPLRQPTELLPPARSAQARALAPLLQDNHLRVMSSAHYQALREALYKNTFRQVGDNPWPTAQLTKGGILGEAQLRPPAADGQALLPPEQVELWATAMWRQREELSDLDADALDALSALWLYQARSVQDRAVADVDGLLAMRGIKPRSRGNGYRSGYEPEQRAEMLRAVAHIQNLWINIAEVDAPAPPGPAGRDRAPAKRVVQSRAFVVTDRVGQVDLTGNLDVDKFVFRPGEVFAHFLLGPGSQTALLSAMALKYDPYRQTWEKRLARYLSWQWRTKARNSDYLRPYRVATLLDAVGKDLDERRPAVTRERLEKALDILQRDGVITAWQYDRWEEGLARQRGWGHTWLEATLLIEPPEAVKEHYQPLERQRQPAPRAALPAGLGERIKRRRKDLGLNQKEAGELLGVTQAYISMLERGKIGGDRLSAAFRQRLETWLAVEGSGG